MTFDTELCTAGLPGREAVVKGNDYVAHFLPAVAVYIPRAPRVTDGVAIQPEVFELGEGLAASLAHSVGVEPDALGGAERSELSRGRAYEENVELWERPLGHSAPRPQKVGTLAPRVQSSSDADGDSRNTESHDLY